MIDYNVIEAFVKLVTDGQPISEVDVCPTCHYGHNGPIGRARKQAFLEGGRYTMSKLALKLGVFGIDDKRGKPWVSVNAMSPAMSGVIYLEAPCVSVSFQSYTSYELLTPLQQRGFSFSKPGSYEVGGWLAWTELLDLRACARKVETALTRGQRFGQVGSGESEVEVEVVVEVGEK